MFAALRQDGWFARVGLPSPDRDIDISGVDFHCAGGAPVRSAAISTVPLPQKGSSTKRPRCEQSLIASATKPTGLTVGCRARSSSRPVRIVLTPG